MVLLKATSSGGSLSDPSSMRLSSELLGFGAVFEWVPDTELRHAMVAANINTLRREAPYLYLVANRYENQPDASDPYIGAMDRRELGRGVWLAYPEFYEETVTTVWAILQGDILPFVPHLYSDWFCLLCLPSPIPLVQIDEIVTPSPSVTESVQKLLKNGGCLLTVIDHVVLNMKTFDTGYAKYFPHK
jgi:hypothetical protein